MRRIAQSIVSPGGLLIFGVALVMGFISAKYLFNRSALNVIPWGIVAITTASLASNRREAMTFGGQFGCVVSFVFLYFNNTNPKTLPNVIVLAPLAGAAALFGLLCGMLAAWAGWHIRSATTEKQ
jgi:hypothetical protein